MRRSHARPAGRKPWWFSSILNHYVLAVLASVTTIFVTQRGCGPVASPEAQQQDNARERREVQILASRLQEREQQLARLEREREEQKRLEREGNRQEEESERERRREMQERLEQQQREKQAVQRALDELEAKIKALEVRKTPTAKKSEPDRDLTGVWRTTIKGAYRSVIRECVFSPTGQISWLDYLPGMRGNTRPPLVGTYVYSNGTLVVEFALGGGRRLKKSNRITWLSDTVIESRISNGGVILVWSRE